MPAKSKSQQRFFYAMKNNPKAAKERGLDDKTINEFTNVSKSRFSKLKERLGKK